MSQLVYTVPQALEEVPMGRSTFYAQIKAGAIQPVKIGRRTYITHDELERFVAALVGSADSK